MCQETATDSSVPWSAAGWRETAAQMRLHVVDYALARSNDVWSGLRIGQHMQNVLLEERRRYNARGDAEMNARRFPPTRCA